MLTYSKARFLCLCALASFPLLADTINYTGVNGEQQSTVATAGIYQIVAYGAQGGGTGAYAGGTGAEIGGDFALNTNEVLDLYIGQAGANGGGGGGTFVLVNGDTSPLIVAGGGGGSGSVFPGAPASLASSGSGGGAAGNTPGFPGAGGGGGGGFSGDGGSVAGGATGGNSFADGLAGGNYGGGYGGGGAGNDGAGGGGGGYQGGTGASFDNGGSGGGSYLDTSATHAILQVGNTGNGFVTIDLVQVTPTVPEPASIALLALGLLAIPIFRRKARRALMYRKNEPAPLAALLDRNSQV